MPTNGDELPGAGRAAAVYAWQGLRWESRPVEALACAAAQEAWVEYGRLAPRVPALPAWCALERLVAEAQLDGAEIGPGDRCSVLVDALLARREAWDELARNARRAFLAAYQREIDQRRSAATGEVLR